MKSNLLDSERQQMLIKYIQQGLSTKSYDVRGKYTSAAARFLERASSVGRRGYRAYCREDASFLVDNPWGKDAICDFLNFFGLGYKKSKDYRKEKAASVLQKRETKQSETINNFMAWLQNEKEYSPNTLQSYQFSVKEYFSYFDSVSSDFVRRYLATLETQGKSPKTICLRISALEKLAEYLNKPVKVKRPKVHRTLNTENIPTEAEYMRLCNYAKEYCPMYYTLLRLMGTTGCRVSELKQFTYEMLREGTVTLKGKGGKYRQFFFVRELAELAKDKTGLVMVNRYGCPMNERGLSYKLKTMCEKCNIDKSKGHPHAFRHFFAKMYLKKTKDVIQLADLLGHGSVDTTRIYLQKSFQEQKREVNRIVNW